MLCFRHAVIVVETVRPVTHENPTKINHLLISPYIKIKKIWHIRISLGSNKPLIQKKKSISEKKRENENRFDAKVNVVYVTLIEQTLWWGLSWSCYEKSDLVSVGQTHVTLYQVTKSPNCLKQPFFRSTFTFHTDTEPFEIAIHNKLSILGYLSLQKRRNYFSSKHCWGPKWGVKLFELPAMT